MYTAVGEGDYVAEKAESATGWLFPVGGEVNTQGYDFMFTDMFDSMDQGKEPMETFYDGYVSMPSWMPVTSLPSRRNGRLWKWRTGAEVRRSAEAPS